MNRTWQQNGDVVATKFKQFPRYRGFEILMDPRTSVTADFGKLSADAVLIGAFCGGISLKRDSDHPKWKNVKDILALMGLFLYRRQIGKDEYMNNLPYQYGQLLKAADELHALYCNVVRKGDIPPQFAGGSLFSSAVKMPLCTFNLLGQRIMPYYTWAKSYRLKGVEEEGKESRRAGWLYLMCEQIAGRLQTGMTPQTRFNDEEQAQLFIGYLAAFPKKDQHGNSEKEDLSNV